MKHLTSFIAADRFFSTILPEVQVETVEQTNKKKAGKQFNIILSMTVPDGRFLSSTWGVGCKASL